jgi:RNA polymerase sigma-B factor
VGRVEDDLLQRYVARRDLTAREELVARMRPIIRRLARRYRHSGYVEDLEQAAALGLTKALERFDPQFGTDLVRYAVPTLRDHSWAVRPPREAAETWLELVSATESLSAVLGHAPTTDDLAAHLNLSSERVVAAMEARRGRWTVSLDAPVHVDTEYRTVADQLGVEDEDLRRAFERAWLDELEEWLEPLERDLVHLYFGADLSQREIAARMGISQMKVCRVLRRAVDRLRAADQAAAA